MEKLVVLVVSEDLSGYLGKRILVTGHTGFKGTWLSRTLTLAGAEVHGIALASEAGSLYTRVGEIGMGSSTILDIRDRRGVESYFKKKKFDGVFHLAAQPLVLKSYEEPVETFETNVLGTAHVLDSIIKYEAAPWIVAITTDKVYKNIEVSDGYKEDDALGGKDPYSASKSATEMVVNAWRAISESRNLGIVLCSARAGNVIGGGDIAKDRLLPDLIRSFNANSLAVIRNPNSLRPWQHVLDPINGYIKIGKMLMEKKLLAHSYNFGPKENSRLIVEEMAKAACCIWGNDAGYIVSSDHAQPPESRLLWLSSERAFQDLSWENKLNAEEAIRWTLEWEKFTVSLDVKSVLDQQIGEFFRVLV
jgi:CDP-glucose 4,6-dehydratase